MELEVKHDEPDPVLCHLDGMPVVQYPDDLHADESKKDVLKDPEYDALQEDDDEDDDESMGSGGERMSENKTKVKKEGGVRTDHKWALVRKENEAEKGDWELFKMNALSHDTVNWNLVRSGSWGGVWQCCLHVNCGKLIRVVNCGEEQEGFELYECYDHGYIKVDDDGDDDNDTDEATPPQETPPQMIVEEVTHKFQVLAPRRRQAPTSPLSSSSCATHPLVLARRSCAAHSLVHTAPARADDARRNH